MPSPELPKGDCRRTSDCVPQGSLGPSGHARPCAWRRGEHHRQQFCSGRGIKRTVKVPLTTIDILVQELHLDRVDFIKMDIEGSEKPALRGAAQTIKKFSPRMAIASEHLPDDPTRIPETVNTIRPGYKITATHC